MATRSLIGIKIGKRVEFVYCHWDGYLANNGRTLFRFYQNKDKIKALISVGDMSSLGIDLCKQDLFNSDRNTNISWETTISWMKSGNRCSYYNRDFGRDEDTGLKTLPSVNKYKQAQAKWGCEYQYLYQNGAWYYRYDSKNFIRLTEEKIAKEIE